MVQPGMVPSSSAADLHGVRDDVVRRVRGQRWRAFAGVLASAAAVVLTGAVASLWLSVVGTGECEQADDDVASGGEEVLSASSAGAEEICVRRAWWPLTIQQRSEHWTANGVDDGPRIEWYANGQPWLVGTYDHGARVGPWREYWENGVVRFKGAYVDDRLNGVEAWWRPDGTLEWSVERRAGVRHGVERVYSPAGRLRSETGWFDGEKHGRYVTYDDNGAVAVVIEYMHGVPVR